MPNKKKPADFKPYGRMPPWAQVLHDNTENMTFIQLNLPYAISVEQAEVFAEYLLKVVSWDRGNK